MKRIEDAAGLTAVQQWEAAGSECPRATLATAVRWSLQELAQLLPGHAVEVRIPPFGAVQVLGGTTHRRGTPPAVVEMDPHTWLRVVTGASTWHQCEAAGLVQASGERADLSPYLPLLDRASSPRP